MSSNGNSRSSTPAPIPISVPPGYPAPNGIKPSMCRKLSEKPVERNDRNGEFTSVYVADMIFYGVGELDKDDVCKLWQCRMCPPIASPVRQVISSGYHNLIKQHIQTTHGKEWERFIQLQEANSEAKRTLKQADLMELVDQKSFNVYDWMHWIVADDLPLHFVEKATTRKYSKLSPICYETLLKYIRFTARQVEFKIKEILDKVPYVGLMFDGSTAKDATHYMSVYAILPILDYYERYGPNDSKPYYESYLIGFAPLLEEDDFSSEAHFDFIACALDQYGKNWEHVAFIVTDNENLNKAMSNLAGVPMIGCASHRLSLAIKANRSGVVQRILEKVNNLMKKLRTKKGRGLLRKKTDIAPKKSMPTRWSADKMMLESYMKLEGFIDSSNRDLAPLIPSADEKINLTQVDRDFKWLDHFTVLLQSDKLDLAEVRCMLDVILAKYPDYKSHIAQDASIVHSRDFEKAVVKVVSGKEYLLSGNENDSLSKFRKENWISDIPQANESNGDSADNIALEILKKARKEYAARESMFIPLNWIPPTSVKCERSFSWFGNIHTNDRQSLCPTTVEDLMMLKCNPNLWDAYVVGLAVHEAKNAARM